MARTDAAPRAALALSITLAVLLAGATVGVLWVSVLPPGAPWTFVDIEAYRRGLADAVAGRSIYPELPYPPIALIPMSVLAGLPKLAAEQLWTGVTIALVIAMTLVTARAARPAGRRAEGFAVSAGIGCVLVLLSYPSFFHISVGQISVLVTALAFFDASGVVPRRQRGALVGAATAVKLTPGIFLVYYAVTRQWRALVIAATSFGVLTAIAFGLFPQDSAYFWTHPNSAGLDFGSFLNTSILGVLSNVFGDSAVVRAGWIVLALGVGAAALFRARGHFLRGEQFQAALVVGIASTVVSPLAWPHFQLWQVLAAVWLLLSGNRRNLALGIALYATCSLPAASLLFGAVSDTPAAAIGRVVQLLAGVAVCLLGLPHSERAAMAPTGEPAIMES